MDWIVFGLSTGLMANGVRLFLRDKKLRDMIIQVEKSRNFDLDYIPSIDGLPRDKPICLRGYVEGGELSTILDPKESMIVSKVSNFVKEKQTAQEEGEIPIGDNYIVTIPKNKVPNKPLYLYNEKGEHILLNLFAVPEVMFHNTYTVKADPETVTSNNVNSILSRAGEVSTVGIDSGIGIGKPELFEMGLKNGQPYNFIGKISKYDGSCSNPKGANTMMKSSIVTGEMREVVVKYLDLQIMKNHKKARISLVGTAIVCSGWLFYKKFMSPAREEIRIREAERDKRRSSE